MTLREGMALLHSTWFWILVIGAPLITIVSTLVRLARKEPPIKLPPGVVPQPWSDDDDDEQGPT